MQTFTHPLIHSCYSLFTHRYNSYGYSLVARLPASHLCLLRHLVCVLQQITSLAARHNHMNAYNLAVCTAPSLLWNVRHNGNVHNVNVSAHNVSNVLGNETEGLDKLPLVVQHMIERCREIFGDDVTRLFGEPRVRDDDDNADGDGEENVALIAVPSAGSGGGSSGGKQRDSSTDSDSMHSLLSLHDTHTGTNRQTITYEIQ